MYKQVLGTGTDIAVTPDGTYLLSVILGKMSLIADSLGDTMKKTTSRYAHSNKVPLFSLKS